MTCLERMCRALRTTGLYRLEEGGLLMAQMEAFAAGFAVLEQAIERARQSFFYLEAQCPAAAQYEYAFGFSPTEQNGDEEAPYSGDALTRREKVIAAMKKRLLVSAGNGTPESLKQAAESWGASVEFTEDLDNNLLTVTVTQDDDLCPDADALQAQLNKLLPWWASVEFAS